MEVFEAYDSPIRSSKFNTLEDFKKHMKELQMRQAGKPIYSVKPELPILSPEPKPQNHECEFRELLDLECDVTLPASTESMAELNFYQHDERMANHIKDEIGEFPEEDFKQLQEDNKKLDELLSSKNNNLDGFIHGCTNEL